MVHATPVALAVAVGVGVGVGSESKSSRCCRCGVLQEFRELSRVMLSGRDNKLRVCSLAAFYESHGHDWLSLSLSPTLSRSFSNDACCNEMSLVLHSVMHLKWAAFLKGCPVAIAARQCVISRLKESGGGQRHKRGIFRGVVAAENRD